MNKGDKRKSVQLYRERSGDRSLFMSKARSVSPACVERLGQGGAKGRERQQKELPLKPPHLGPSVTKDLVGAL